MSKWAEHVASYDEGNKKGVQNFVSTAKPRRIKLSVLLVRIRATKMRAKFCYSGET